MSASDLIYLVLIGLGLGIMGLTPFRMRRTASDEVKGLLVGVWLIDSGLTISCGQRLSEHADPTWGLVLIFLGLVVLVYVLATRRQIWRHLTALNPLLHRVRAHARVIAARFDRGDR